MAAILQTTTFSLIHFLVWKFSVLIQIPLKFVPKGPVYKIWALVQIMAWHQSGQAMIWTTGGLVYWYASLGLSELTHCGRVTHICVSNLTIIGSDNGLLPDRHQAIICTNDGIVLIGPIGRNSSEILIKIYTFSFKELHFKRWFVKRQPFNLSLNRKAMVCFVEKLNVLSWSLIVIYSVINEISYRITYHFVLRYPC